ncbi:MAG TPA: MBL fold metallo-hydrolase [Gemmatimonas sp.]|nr:MBL fold metallo-hydrolase [Gemmatimonas sp.]
MLRVTVLGSGSRGNAILVDGDEGAVLVDAGFGPRMLAKRLLTAGRRPDQISSVVLTHEHRDHACGAVQACRRWNWTLRASAATLAALRESPDGCDVATASLDNESGNKFDGWQVAAIPVPHDARDCRALVFTSDRSGERLGIALDLGHVPTVLPASFERLDLLVVESNHDERMLANGPYPRMLKQRIGGALGHLSNGAAAGFIAACVHRGLRGVVLAHLSETNNTPELALARSREALRRAGWRRESLWAAHQTVAIGPHGSVGPRDVFIPDQLSLGL